MKCRLAALIFILLFAASGCVSAVSSPEPPAVDYTAAYADAWCYQTLSEQQRANYAAIYAAVREGFSVNRTVAVEQDGKSLSANGETITLPHPLTDAKDIERLYTALLRDHPALFYIGSTYSYEGYSSGGKNYYKKLYLTYTMDAAARTNATAALDVAVSDCLREVGTLKTQYEKELWLHDRLLEICTYNKTAAESTAPLTAYPNDFTAYGALVKGTAVCEGYACAMQLLLNRAGIRCTPVSGFDENGQPHMWNLAEVDGGTYYLDATWNDAGRFPVHLYFNMTTADLLLSHSPDRDNFGLKTYTDTAANFFVRSGRYVDVYDRDTIAQLVAEAADAGETCVELRFSADKYTNARRFIYNESWFRSSVEEKMAHADSRLWEYEYSLYPVYHVITLRKKT